MANIPEVQSEEIYERYHKLIAHILVSMKVPDSEIEDLIQEVFTRVLGHMTSLRDDNNMKAWISAICRNAGRDSRNRFRARKLVELQETHFIKPPPQPWEVLKREQNEKLGQCLANLTPSSQQLIHQRFYQELPWKQIAESKGLQVDATRKRTGKVLVALRNCLEKKGFVSNKHPKRRGSHKTGLHWIAMLIGLLQFLR